MSTHTVRDRSGRGLPPKAERRALGKAAAQKRARQRRRKQILSRVAQIAAPIAVVGVIVGAIVLFGGGGDDQATDPTTASTTSPPTAPTPTRTPWTLPEGLDPQLATKPVVTGGEGTLSELKVTTIVAGTGAPVQAGDVITVNYVGVLYASGEEFESSFDPTPSPVQFTIGVGDVIDGWDQGLVGVPVGSRVQVDIPVTLAYNYRPGRPEGDLRFVVDILGVAA